MSTFLGEDRNETIIYVDPLAGGQHLHESESITIPYDIRTKNFFVSIIYQCIYNDINTSYYTIPKAWLIRRIFVNKLMDPT